MNIGVRVAYSIISIVALIGWVILIVRKVEYKDWNYELKACLGLLLGLQLFNNPFHAGEYFSAGWVLPFFNAELELLFFCILMMYWTFSAVAMRKYLGAKAGGVREESPWPARGKLAGIGLFAALTSSFFLWESVHLRLTPVFGISGHVTGLQVLFYIASVIYSAVVIWIAFAIIMSIPKAFDNGQMSVRFLFFGLPTGFVMAAILVGAFSGNLLSFGRSTMSFMFYHTVMQCYVYLMVWGFWPVERHQKLVDSPTEETNIFDPKTSSSYL